MNLLKKIDNYFEEYLSAFLLIVMTGLIFFQVVSRFILNIPLAWSEESARYAFVWLIYISAALAVKHHEHIRVEIGLILFKGRAKLIALVFTDIIFLIFSLILLKDGISLVMMITKHGQISPAVGFSMNYVYAIIPIGYGLMVLRLIQDIIKKIKEIVKFKK
ncbi:MAG: TRAP transporter small permease [Clostridiales bacterium]|nr:TRAP transporter small permease [Clostridiales bacterium]